MRWKTTPKLQVWTALVGIGLLAAMAFGRPEPVVLIAPMTVVLVAALVTERPKLTAGVSVDPTVVREGETITITVTVTATSDCLLEVLVVVPAGLTVDAHHRLRGIALAADRPRELTVVVAADRWGTYDLGEIWFRVRSRFTLIAAEATTVDRTRAVVHPRPETVRHLVAARHTQSAAGNQTSRAVGSGFECAGVRPFRAGDRSREVNWRATARRSTLWVNERHPERSTEVVLFLDAFGTGTLERAVRATNSLATAYLAHHDRVGLVSFGGSLRWLRSGMGLRQQYMLVDTLLATRPFASVARRDVRLIPPQALAPRALVVAITPLEDERMLDALTDLRNRGIDLVVIEVSPTPTTPVPPGRAGLVAYRLWELQRALTRDQLRDSGVPVVEWTRDRPITEVIEEVRAWPRSRRSVS